MDDSLYGLELIIACLRYLVHSRYTGLGTHFQNYQMVRLTLEPFKMIADLSFMYLKYYYRRLKYEIAR
jgi:hypothetical protein